MYLGNGLDLKSVAMPHIPTPSSLLAYILKSENVHDIPWHLQSKNVP